MPTELEPMDKLDATTTHTADTARAVVDAGGVVNGPEGGDLDWAGIDWGRAEADVRRLRQRIFSASKAGDLGKVRNRL
jgi:RNA-directed DNA polymerase